MDFIEKLPNSDGYSAILVVVDRLTKQAIFIPTHDTVTSAQLAHLFLLHVFSKHGVPSHVTSDRGSEFVSHFFRSLGQALDMKLHFTSGYHPEADGQTERTNQTLEQYLRVYCNYQQDNWSHLLPLAEFAFNNSPSATTGISPFFANKGYHPNLSVHMDRELTSTRAKEFVVDLDELHRQL
jgi:IS30 family transposase